MTTFPGITGSRTTCNTPFVGCEALLLIVMVSVAVRARGLITVYSRCARAVEEVPRKQRQKRRRLKTARRFEGKAKIELGESDSTGMLQTRLNRELTWRFSHSGSQ